MRYIDDSTAHEMFDEGLDEGPEVEVAGLTFAPSTILRECDPVAYRCYFNDWADAEGITVSEDEADDETCRGEDCDNSTDDGEGWDGLCGNCADRAEAADDDDDEVQA